MIEGHGDDSYKYRYGIKINFSSNVYNAVDHSGLRAYLYRRMSVVASYPEPEPYSLEEILARQLDLPPESVCATNGATEAIYLVAQTFRGGTAAVVAPTFSEYADACRIHGHRVVYISNLEDIPPGTDTVWVCNPNNPTGRVTEPEFLKSRIAAHPEICFVIDQSYEYFTLQPVLSAKEAAGYPNVVLLHSMTKRYAVPGLRLGYFTAGRSLAEKIRSNRMPWSVNALAAEAGKYLLEYGLPGTPDMAAYLDSARRLAGRIGELGAFEVFPSDTHFMLIRIRCPYARMPHSFREGTEGRWGKNATGNRMLRACGGPGMIGEVGNSGTASIPGTHGGTGSPGWQPAADLKEYLAVKEGILIRDASNFYGLDGTYFRIAAQTERENECLTEGLRKWAAETERTGRAEKGSKS